MKNLKSSSLRSAIKYFTLPLLGAIYPATFHYANNAKLVLLSSFIELSIFLAIVAFIIYIFLTLFSRGKFLQSALGALLVLIFFHTYGFVFDWLYKTDVLQVETYNFLPFWVLVAVYAAWMLMKIKLDFSAKAWQASMLVFGILVTFNVIKIIPAEMTKNENVALQTQNAIPIESNTIDQQYPDIYYFVFDEGAGFEAMRQYWHYNQVDEFVQFLESSGFYVAEESHGGSINTLHEMATRLNYKEYPVGDENYKMYSNAIGNNLVMSYLKDHGYSVIAYDERRTPYPTMLPVPADTLIEQSPEKSRSGRILLDDYKVLVLQSTMLRSFLSQDPEILPHRDMILYTSENVASLQVPSPRFVYVHLMLPHVPFAFTENGNITGSRAEYFNWQRYLENYKFFLRIAREVISNSMTATQGKAVIIMQSDHGARNITIYPYIGYLQNYPDEYKTLIINALYLPGCENAPLTQDMDPINTFPIIFNCYFGENIPLK